MVAHVCIAPFGIRVGPDPRLVSRDTFLCMSPNRCHLGAACVVFPYLCGKLSQYVSAPRCYTCAIRTDVESYFLELLSGQPYINQYVTTPDRRQNTWHSGVCNRSSPPCSPTQPLPASKLAWSSWTALCPTPSCTMMLPGPGN